jgi:copper chaperone CopZ
MVRLQIERMHCSDCIQRVREVLEAIPGTRVEDVQIGKARIESEAEPTTILMALRAVGYPAVFES